MYLVGQSGILKNFPNQIRYSFFKHSWIAMRTGRPPPGASAANTSHTALSSSSSYVAAAVAAVAVHPFPPSHLPCVTLWTPSS